MRKVARRLGAIDEILTTDATRAPFAKFDRSLLRAAARRDRFRGRFGDTDDRRRLRAVADRRARHFGRIRRRLEVTRGADRRWPADAARADRRRCDRQAAATHGNAALFARLLRRPNAKPRRRSSILSLARRAGRFSRSCARAAACTVAVAAVAQPGHVDLPRAVPGQSVGAAAALAFITATGRRCSRGGDFRRRHHPVRALGAFCDAPSRDAIASFFSTHPLARGGADADPDDRTDHTTASRCARSDAGLTAWLAAR